MRYRRSAPLPSCKVESLETRIVNIHVFIYRLWCFTETSWHIFTFFVTFRSLAVVQNLGISTRGWLVFNCVFRFGEHKCTQFLSGLKKVVFLYYIHTTYDTIVERRTKCARANSHTPGPNFIELLNGKQFFSFNVAKIIA